MKKTITLSISMLLIFMLCLTSCNTVDAEGLWEDATHRRDMTFGKGEKTIEVEVKVEDQSVTFTINTDEKYLADAMLEHELIEGEEGAFGLYVKKVNGITADYDKDKAWWGLYKNGEVTPAGASFTEIADGEHYEFVYSK